MIRLFKILFPRLLDLYLVMLFIYMSIVAYNAFMEGGDFWFYALIAIMVSLAISMGVFRFLHERHMDKNLKIVQEVKEKIEFYESLGLVNIVPPPGKEDEKC